MIGTVIISRQNRIRTNVFRHLHSLKKMVRIMVCNKIIIISAGFEVQTMGFRAFAFNNFIELW